MSRTALPIPSTSKQWQLVQRPASRFAAHDVALIEAPLPPTEEGQVLVVNTHLSVDPYMRGRMNDAPSYIEPFSLHAPLEGGAIGVVVESRSDRLVVGDVVEHFLGLRNVTLADAGAFARIDLAGRTPESYLSALGSTGLTAWVATTVVARIREGDAVLVTGAAGAVGSLAGQLARQQGAARVIGVAGSERKAAYVVGELGFDDAVNYRTPDAVEQLGKYAVRGIDVVIDNVGGPMLEAAIDLINVGGRIALVGMASEYDGREPHSFTNLFTLIKRRVRMEGLIVTDYLDRLGQFRDEVGRLLDAGRLTSRHTTFSGLEMFPAALQAVLSSGSALDGKTILRIT